MLALGLPALASEPTLPATSLTVLKRNGKELFAHTFPASAPDGATHLVNQGRWTWTAVLYRQVYDQRIETCVDLWRLHPRRDREEVGRPCIVVDGRETPQAELQQDNGSYTMVLAVSR